MCYLLIIYSGTLCIIWRGGYMISEMVKSVNSISLVDPIFFTATGWPCDSPNVYYTIKT